MSAKDFLLFSHLLSAKQDESSSRHSSAAPKNHISMVAKKTVFINFI